jgi:hypothetical protein
MEKILLLKGGARNYLGPKSVNNISLLFVAR